MNNEGTERKDREGPLGRLHLVFLICGLGSSGLDLKGAIPWGSLGLGSPCGGSCFVNHSPIQVNPQEQEPCLMLPQPLTLILSRCPGSVGMLHMAAAFTEGKFPQGWALCWTYPLSVPLTPHLSPGGGMRAISNPHGR